MQTITIPAGCISAPSGCWNGRHRGSGRGFRNPIRTATWRSLSIALEGALRARDSMGNMKVLRPGEIQVMSAGIGHHAQRDERQRDRAGQEFLQIWVLTDAQNHTPRYNQVELAPAKPQRSACDRGAAGRGGEHVGWVHQDAWFYTLDLRQGSCVVEYRMNTAATAPASS
ncbi:MAG: pirin family protein [Alistipes sp.]